MSRRFAHSALRPATVVLLITTTALASAIIHVPAQQPTIQAGINAANNGDTVLVAPGTYQENINFNGKAITVKSSNGAKVTIIDGQKLNSVVTFNSGETNSSVLNGFTIQNGTASEGGGITVQGSAPLIINNVITNNGGCDGVGIGVGFGSPVIRGNIISNNARTTCSGGLGGGGISIRGASTPQIIGNAIANNNAGDGVGGGGISLFAAGAPTIMNNIISNNTVQTGGGAISMVNQSDATIIQNLIYNNTAPQGSGIYFLVPSGARGPLIVNNTVAAGTGATQGTAVFASGFDNQVQLYNNLLIGLSGQNAVYCDNTYSSMPPTFTANDAYSPNGTGLQGTCASQGNTNGNISANPKFVGSNNFRLKGGSLAIDAGNNSAADLPTKDLVNNPRIVNGNDLPVAIVDMGAYEFVPVVLAPKSLSFGLHAVGSSTSKTVKLTNAQNKVLHISSYSVPTGYSVIGCGTSVAAFTNCTLTVTFNPQSSGTFKGVLSVKDDAGDSPQTVNLSGSAQ